MKSIRLINIRSFEDSTKINISPLTLLVGQNSSGKSTLARIFPLLRQTSEVLAREPLLWFGRLTDFGSAEEAGTKWNNDKSIGIDFEFEIDRLTISRRQRGLVFYRAPPSKSEKIQVKVGIRYWPRDKESYAFHFDFFDHTIEIKIKGSEVENLKINQQDYTEIVGKTLSVSTWISCFPSIKVSDTQTGFSETNPFTKRLLAFVRENTHGKSSSNRVDAITRGLLSADLSRPLESIKNPSAGDSMWHKTTQSWTPVHSIYHEIKNLIIGARLPEVLEIASSIFKNECSKIRYIAPIRASAERYYRQQGLSLDEIDPLGQNVAMFLHNLSPSERIDFTSWMESGFGFSIDTHASPGHISLVIRDPTQRNQKQSLNLADTGFGFSQMLPVLAQVWLHTRRHISSSTNTTKSLLLVIEQPELHLHPKLQAKLTDVFIQSIHAAKERGLDLQMVIETHSEQIINKLGQRIASGQLAPNDVSVNIFEKYEFFGPTKTIKTTYDADGMLEDWPFGFFETAEDLTKKEEPKGEESNDSAF